MIFANGAFFLISISILSSACVAQVYDIDGDGMIGPGEAIAIGANWKGVASASNEHDHLGQTWEGRENPLVIEGLFEERFRRVKTDKGLLLKREKTAPLMLNNSATDEADLRLQGMKGVIGAQEHEDSEIVLVSNRHLTFDLNGDGAGGLGVLYFKERGEVKAFIDANGGFAGASIIVDGNISAGGNVTAQNITLKSGTGGKGKSERVYYPLLIADQSTLLLSGRAILGKGGEATVHVPEGDSPNLEESHFQLTPIGTPSPNLHIAEILSEESRFIIAGGVEGQEVSWQVTGPGPE
ncbi:MAG: hypothetical protein KC931_00630 [Candidatus Omnitrophica bacterium]|nr:hypothetical protein [Candidatus Omnitrophota bacterium]